MGIRRRALRQAQGGHPSSDVQSGEKGRQRKRRAEQTLGDQEENPSAGSGWTSFVGCPERWLGGWAGGWDWSWAKLEAASLNAGFSLPYLGL